MPKPTLLMLHFAGGNCYSFNPFNSFFKEFNLVIPELPGRGKRINEALLKDFELAAEDLFQQVIKMVQAPEYLIFGHSMGAAMALKLAGMLEGAGRPPAAIIVSGNAGPGTGRKEKTYLLDDAGFRAELEKLGGISRQVFDDEELFSFFEPILRADFEIVDKQPLHVAPVNVPVYAVMGSEEETVSKIHNWEKYTTAGFDYEVLSGNHFFLFEHSGRIAEIIKSCYHKYALS
ncbi:thioesterase II family protein [Pedobacter cryoconitis]|uniref:Surfactin synthase thioesterase subunit n=1 Tax=Pedobacter cryoconitis TaxID=188932 RepID=A0A327SE54_9SPHI|nr:alpha/beta fold hydrolase [Pedobacter cryoconitis]RAJ26905.1 surfactin synthase thioesterase subunit [Pedobacter cryoconitis]